MRILLDSKEIGFFDLNSRGRIIKTGDPQYTTWERVYVDLDTLEVGSPPKLTFNKFERKKEGLLPVYTNLNYLVTKII